MPVKIEMRVVRLAQGFEQRRRILQKRHAKVVRPGIRLQTELQMIVHVLVALSREAASR